MVGTRYFVRWVVRLLFFVRCRRWWCWLFDVAAAVAVALELELVAVLVIVLLVVVMVVFVVMFVVVARCVRGALGDAVVLFRGVQRIALLCRRCWQRGCMQWGNLRFVRTHVP